MFTEKEPHGRSLPAFQDCRLSTAGWANLSQLIAAARMRTAALAMLIAACILRAVMGILYKITDNWQLSGGANLFFGKDDYTFFGQFEDNSNLYLGLRYNF